eukprot:CAMPEP_0197346276 /NCGR_PEP_ID=MMETSP0893-20130614/5561_1 /TAXON_ID=44058 ORGANISM="Aureoumbra lagunensis, Strain CCMP1510" /NCGR_SAMPLE_ID=MMETSP0893 /ASSEMBLY_ACC=CAM_ASM_000539 /LENGTH=213 /DNA_ID=CAMNT_0042855099 /DNA_START=87 /DNA_END=728 /DNA_ORIENTATION=-
MKVCVALALMFSGVSALVSTPIVSSRSGIVMKAEMSKSMPFLEKPALLDGTMAGDKGFDPLGLSEIDDVGIDLYWLREAELKHCRVAMLAFAGIVFVELFGPLPGWPFAEGRSQCDVFWDTVEEHPNAIVSAFLALGIVEVITGVAVTQGRESGKRAPGDYGFNPMDFKVTESMAEKEVSNGRLAMWAMAGILLQGVTTHKPALANFGDFFSA